MKPLRTVLIRVELSGVIIVRADLETAWLIEAAAVCRGTDYKRSSIDNEREDGRRNLAGVRRGRNIERLSHGVVRGHSCRERTNSPILSMGNQGRTVSTQDREQAGEVVGRISPADLYRAVAIVVRASAASGSGQSISRYATLRMRAEGI